MKKTAAERVAEFYQHCKKCGAWLRVIHLEKGHCEKCRKNLTIEKQ